MAYRHRVQFEAWEGALLAALGIVASTSCGGSSFTKGDGGSSGEGGESASGATSSGAGGSGATGGASGTGGFGATGATGATGGTSGSGGSGATGGTSAGTGGSGATAGASAGSGGSPATGGSGAEAGMGGTHPIARFPCTDPKPFIDASTGFVLCEDGSIHREAANECPTEVPRSEGMPDYDPARDQCEFDRDCPANSYCGRQEIEGGLTLGYTCISGCVQDSDCAADQLCLCADPIGKCVPATCKTDAECGAGLECASHDPTHGCGHVAFACQTPDDTCRVACAQNMCALNEQGVRECLPGGCAIGRPFLVAGEARTAEVVASRDWAAAASVKPMVFALSEAERGRLAEHWTSAALAEHASVAAFARFALEALALGAPANLLVDAANAMRDEIEHARLCFALASTYGSRDVGPGALDVGTAIGPISLSTAALSTLLEGCVGETLAAIEAAESASHATDSVIAEVLSRIAADEGRHAELAFRFVAWALTLGGARLGSELRAELATVRETLAREASVARDDELLAHGVLSGARRAALRLKAFERVVEPCFERMLEQHGSVQRPIEPLQRALESARSLHDAELVLQPR